MTNTQHTIDKYVEQIVEIAKRDAGETDPVVRGMYNHDYAMVLTTAIEEAREQERKEYRELTIPALCDQVRKRERERIVEWANKQRQPADYTEKDNYPEGYNAAIYDLKKHINSTL